MSQESHDQNFKNLFLDFPKEALEWLLPDVQKKWGSVQSFEFVRQEPKKRKLKDAHLALDMPILFSFEQKRLLLWLVEFQEDKPKFSIYTLLRYTTDFVEAYPDAVVIPTVLCTDRREWRKDVQRKVDVALEETTFLHFQYVFVKLFDYWAKDSYDVPNPVVKILLPKMKYLPEERIEVIWRAYLGLYQLVSAALFEKYIDFIDIYADVTDNKRHAISDKLEDKKETIMIAQYIREKGYRQGLQHGRIGILSRQLARKYQQSVDNMTALLKGLKTDDLLELGERLMDAVPFEDIRQWIRQHQTEETKDAPDTPTESLDAQIQKQQEKPDNTSPSGAEKSKKDEHE